jgi:hypothetical protein
MLMRRRMMMIVKSKKEGDEGEDGDEDFRVCFVSSFSELTSTSE